MARAASLERDPQWRVSAPACESQGMEPIRERAMSQHVAENDVKALLACLELLLAVDRMRSGEPVEPPRGEARKDHAASTG